MGTTRPLARLVRVEFKSATVGQVGGVVADDNDPMVFDIIGSVTGVVDEVNDVVLPGAFTRTLAKRTPKVIKDHDWAKRLGVILNVKELRPGDPDLPATLPNGDPWPAGAGALIAKVRLFNSPEGKQAAERWALDPAQQFSIGYIARKASHRKSDGARLLADMDLLELSDVLWGAMPLCGMLPGALATKMLPAFDDADVLPDDGVDAADLDDDATEEAFEAALHRFGLEDVDWAQIEAAAAGTDPNADDAPVEAAPGEGTQPPQPDASPEAKGKDTTPDAVQRGNAEQLKRWYVTGEGAAKIRWGTDGDLTRCHKLAAKHMTPDQAWGFCQLRHRDATGKYNEKQIVVAADLVTPVTFDATNTKGGYDPALEVGDYAGVKAAPAPADQVTVLEVKDFPRFPGTLEERIACVHTAVCKKLGPTRMDDTVPSGGAESDGPAERPYWSHIRIDATWADRVIASRIRWDGGQDECESFELGYTWDGESVTLGEPVRIRLQITATAAPDENGPSYEDGDPRAGAATLAVKDAAAQLHVATMETKAGRVLSRQNARRLQDALQHLLAVAQAAGLAVLAPGEAPPTPKPSGQTNDPESTAPSAQDTTEVKMSPAELEATLARFAGV